jgi:hypothetical protein
MWWFGGSWCKWLVRVGGFIGLLLWFGDAVLSISISAFMLITFFVFAITVVRIIWLFVISVVIFPPHTSATSP